MHSTPLFHQSHTKTAEKYHTYWYAKADKDIKRILSLQARERVAKNVILFLGDGMGVNTLTGKHSALCNDSNLTVCE